MCLKKKKLIKKEKVKIKTYRNINTITDRAYLHLFPLSDILSTVTTKFVLVIY